MYEQELSFKIIQALQYPPINRYNREIYSKEPQPFSPYDILRNTFLASIMGYALGRKKRKEAFYCFGFAGIVLFGHWLTDISMKSYGYYQDLLIVKNSENVQKSEAEAEVDTNIKQPTEVKTLYQFPIKSEVESEKISIELLVSSLPRSYFV